jgi:hypothetical protein
LVSHRCAREDLQLNVSMLDDASVDLFSDNGAETPAAGEQMCVLQHEPGCAFVSLSPVWRSRRT